MTGLNPEVDCLVEIAVVVTNSELEILDEGIDIVIKPTPEGLANMGEFVTNMHTESGLINEFEHGLELADAEQIVLEYVKRFVPEARTAPLAGNTIGTDRMFINRYMPQLDSHLHYRNIDAAGIRGFTSTCQRRMAATVRLQTSLSRSKNFSITARRFSLTSLGQPARWPSRLPTA
jgi:oligoribonuclease